VVHRCTPRTTGSSAATGVWDLPPAWPAQLDRGGRIVVPLRIRGLTASVALEPDGIGVTSRGYQTCAFVPTPGCIPAERVLPLDDDDTSLHVEGRTFVDAEGLGQALSCPGVEAWSGLMTVGQVPVPGLHLWLATQETHIGIITASDTAVESSAIGYAWPPGLPTLFDESSLAHLQSRSYGSDSHIVELGAVGYGPDAEELGARLVRHIQSWDGSNADAAIAVYPAGTPDQHLPTGAVVLDRPQSRMAISWPPTLGKGSPPFTLNFDSSIQIAGYHLL
jgi:protein-L-isoaspartate(D-aspartate) O-methyltransferase